MDKRHEIEPQRQDSRRVKMEVPDESAFQMPGEVDEARDDRQADINSRPAPLAAPDDAVGA